MKTTVLVVISVVLILLGATWTLQGVGVIKGSFMTGVTLWAVIGPILILAGLATAIFGVRGRRSTP
jgi:hypothetical protein